LTTSGNKTFEVYGNFINNGGDVYNDYGGR
jgi:hypothetical protein